MRRMIGCIVMILCAAVIPSAQASVLPHFFPDGIETLTDPADQFDAYYRYINATSKCTEADDSTFPRMFINSVQVERVIEGKKVNFVLDVYSRTKDGRILFYDFCGQHYVTQEQFDVALDFIVRKSVEAMNAKHAEWSDLDTRAVDAWVMAQKKAQPDRSEDELRALLDQKVPYAPSITFRQLNLLPPKIKKSDSIPREIHLGYFSALGEAWLHSGVVYLSIQALILDELHGHPDIVVHEFTHADPIMQSLPIGDGIDLELMASIPMMLYTWNKTDLFRHHYTADLREMLWVKFGYDFDQARDEIFLFPHDGNLRVNRAKLNEHIEKLEKIKEVCRAFFREKVIPEFYSKPLVWTSIHEAMGDDKGIFRIMFALYFDSTLLGNHSETMRWCKTEEPRIKRAMYDAWTKRLRDLRAEDAKGGGLSTTAIHQLEQRFGISRQEALRLAQKHHLTQEQLQGLPLPDLLDLVGTILEKERDQQHSQGAVR